MPLPEPRLSQWVPRVGGEFHGDDVAFTGVTTDSRTIAGGELFIALRGPRFDGHDHVDAALAAGAVAAMVERPVAADGPHWLVDDTGTALLNFGSAWRGAWGGTAVALTGSNGKTTVKELTAAILGQRHTTLATRGNLNNRIGVPLTLLRLSDAHDRAVIEMGANHPGEIAELTAAAVPDAALITNAGPAHLEGFGSVAGVARAKGEIFAGLPATGTALFPAESEFAGLWRELADGRAVLTFGREAGDVRVTASPEGEGQRLTLETPWGTARCRLPLAGGHNADNAAAAVALALTAGATLEEVAAGLAAAAPVAGRLVRRRGRGGATLLDDTYNANPASLAAGLEVLAAAPGRRILVLGDMGELGEGGEAYHAEAGRAAAAAGIDELWAVGPLAAAAAETFGREGRPSEAQALAAKLQQRLDNNTTVLVKGSRAMGLEAVVTALTEEGR
ncbi:MAG: UDP-N-acetylmuramoyl-tripeptide--D-alanyl-D-alanine ligase [Pseudomonadota bacterium]